MQQVPQQEGVAQEAPAALAPAPTIEWVGPPTYIQNGTPHYKAANIAGQHQISIGDFVYLQPSDPSVPLYIGRIDDFLVSNNVMSANVTWFYRPNELNNLDTPLPVFDNEVFAADESETHPLDSVAGRCIVVPPGSPAQQAAVAACQFDVYVCSRKYISEEGRVVPFADEQLGNEARPFVLVNGRLLPRPAAAALPKQQRAPSAATTAVKTPPSRGAGKRKKREKTQSPTITAPRKRPAPVKNGGAQVAATAAPPEVEAVGTTSVPPLPAAAPSGSVSQGGRTTSEKSGGGGGVGGGKSPRTRKEQHGRWSTDRYEAAQRSLIHILRLMGATSPDVSILRPSLRDEARKVIGDTGLLDHLLKHLADQVVSPEGERLRRRHNREGHMEYWLQDPKAMEQEQELIENELSALSAELREVREARHALQAVRTEAAQAIQAVSGIKEHPTEAAAGLVGMQTPVELASRLNATEQATVQLQQRLYDAESLAASSIEELRKELSQAGKLLGEHIGNFQKAIEELTQRCKMLDFNSAVAAEESAGRFEAVSAALTQAMGMTNVFRQEMAQRDVILGYLQREIAGLRQTMASMAMAAGAGGGSPQQQRQREKPVSQPAQVTGPSALPIQQPQTPLKPPGSAGAAPAGAAPAVQPTTEEALQQNDSSMPLQISRQALEPDTISPDQHEGPNLPRLASQQPQQPLKK